MVGGVRDGWEPNERTRRMTRQEWETIKIQDFEQLEATNARLIEALNLAEQYIASWAERGDEGAKVALRMIVERRAIRG